MTEAELQTRLLTQFMCADGDRCTDAALLSLTQPLSDRPSHSLDEGFDAYARNMRGGAARALAAALPTVVQLLGEAWFEHCATAYWQAEPPAQGVWSAWGAGFASWFTRTNPQDAAAQYPYMADIARLDWAMHCAELAADLPADASTWVLLSSEAPEQIGIGFCPSTAVIQSAYPIHAIWARHQSKEHQDQDAAARVAAGKPESVIIWRQGWRAQCDCVSAPFARFTQALLENRSLAVALDTTSDADGFDFEYWLNAGLGVEAGQGWFKFVRRL